MRRTIALLVLLGLAGCSHTPGSLGITGPGTPPTPVPTSGDAIMSKDPTDQGNPYVPSMVPNQGGSTRFYGYD